MENQVIASRKLADVEREHILATLEQCGRHRGETAKALGISIRCLYAKLNQYGTPSDGCRNLRGSALADRIEAFLRSRGGSWRVPAIAKLINERDRRVEDCLRRESRFVRPERGLWSLSPERPSDD